MSLLERDDQKPGIWIRFFRGVRFHIEESLIAFVMLMDLFTGMIELIPFELIFLTLAIICVIVLLTGGF